MDIFYKVWIGLCFLSILCLWYLFVNLSHLRTHQKIAIVAGLVLLPMGYYGADTLIVLVPYICYVWWLTAKVARENNRI